MDVIDELIAHCEAWEPWARVMGNVCAGDAAQALRSLRAELAETKQDVARYHWLRSRVPGGAYRIMGVIYSEGGSGVDAAIDAAMAGGANGQ